MINSIAAVDLEAEKGSKDTKEQYTYKQGLDKKVKKKRIPILQ